VWFVWFVVRQFKKLTTNNTNHTKKNTKQEIFTLSNASIRLIRPIHVQKDREYRFRPFLHFFTGGYEKLPTKPVNAASKYTKAKAGLLRLHEVQNVIKK
jgi:hypothetical protein